jgi:hypothetical protein
MYHFFMGIFLWSYYQIIFTQAGSPNEEVSNFLIILNYSLEMKFKIYIIEENNLVSLGSSASQGLPNSTSKPTGTSPSLTTK